MINKLKALNLNFKNIYITPILVAKVILGQKSTGKTSTSITSKTLFFLRGLKQYICIKIGIVKNADVLFLTSNHYEVEEKTVVYDKFITPFVQYLQKRNKTYKIARYTNTFTVAKNYFAGKELINLQEAGVLAIKLNKAGSDIDVADDNASNEFLRLLRETDLSKDVNPLDATYLLNFLILKDFFKIYLQKSHTKHIVVVCYYDLKSFAMVLAANELGVSVIDLQHGVQGIGHFAYNYWPNEIVESSKLFPTHFWCWDEWSAKAIKVWFPQKENVITGSNVWMKQRIKPEQKTQILFTAQPLEDAIPRDIINAVKNYNGKLRWSIRMHPHQLGEISKYKQLLAEHNILHLVEFENATNLPLTEILNKSYIHITNYSSVVLEAMWFGVPSIVISEQGTQYYREQVPEKMLISAYTATEILDKIEKLEKEWTFNESNTEDKENFDELANKFFNYDG